MTRLWYVPFAGALGETLPLLFGARARPPTGYMGSKGSPAMSRAILGAFGHAPGDSAEAALLVDAGPWGWAWQHLLQPETARAVAAELRTWRSEDPVALWKRLAASPPPEELVNGLATWLWLQARSANACPVWWDEERWAQGSGGPMTSGKLAEEVDRRERGASSGWRMGDKPRMGLEKGAVQRGHHADPEHPHVQWGRRPAEPMALGSQVLGTRFGGPGDHEIRQKGIGRPGEQGVQQAAREIRPKGTGAGRCRGMIDPGTIALRLEVIAHHVAAYLCLQAGAFSTKPVVVQDGAWKTPGYAHLSDSARERGFTARLRPDQIALHGDRLAGVRAPTIIVAHARAEDCLPQGDLQGVDAYLDPPYLGLAPVVATATAALRLLAAPLDSPEWGATLDAVGSDGLRQAVAHLRVALREVLGSVRHQLQVLDAVVEWVVVLVVHDFVLRQWAAEVMLHQHAMLAAGRAIDPDEVVAALDPSPLGSPSLALRGEALERCGHLRRALSLFHEALPYPSSMLREAGAWADRLCAHVAALTLQDGPANVAGYLDEHRRILHGVRQPIITRWARGKTASTGYAADCPRETVLDLARDLQARGARVVISEAEPLPLDGWHHLELTGIRSAGGPGSWQARPAKGEWLTCSHPPVRVPARQCVLFG